MQTARTAVPFLRPFRVLSPFRGPFLGALALAAGISLGAGIGPARADTLLTIDFPSGSQTHGLAVNDNGDMAGIFTASNNATEGYERYANGTFSAAIVDPNDNYGQTIIYGLNSAGTIVGEYVNQNSSKQVIGHGFFLKNGVYTTFDVSAPQSGGPYSTGVFAINNAGDFAGSFGNYAQSNDEAFLDVNGMQTVFSGPAGNTGTFPTSLNDKDVVVGKYNDSSGHGHGFLRDPSTGVVTTVDYPGAAQSGLTGINDAGTMVGYYVDVYGGYHGYIDKAGVFTGYDVPGATSTAVVGISNQGVTVGNQTDNYGNFHGFLNTPTPGPTHILWDNTNGMAALWSYTPASGAYTASNFGPYSGWTAKSVADSSTDGLTRLLWDKTDGTAALWTVTTTGTFTATNFGPYSGWTANAVSVGSDNTTHILWTNTSGKTALWNVVNGKYQSEHDFGPYAGWTAEALAEGTDGKTRMLWTNTNGMAAFWTVTAATGAFSQFSFGPYSGWTAKAISASSTTTHVLWSNTNGVQSVWNYNPASGTFTTENYGPYSGWAATALADGTDGKTRLLWDNVSGQASFWNLDNTTGTFSAFSFGPYSGWTATAISAGA